MALPQSAVPPRCKNPGEFPRCVSLRPRPRAPAPASAPPRKAPRAGLLSYTSRERKCRVLHVTSKRANTLHVEKKSPRADSSPGLGLLVGPSERRGASQVLPFSLSRCYVCMGCRVIVFRKGSRLATRCVSVRLDSIDSIARSLSMFLAVPDRACSCLLAADYVLFCLVLLTLCVSAVLTLPAGTTCLADCFVHPKSLS